MSISNKSCSVPDCERTHHCKGYCELHYSRMRNNGTLIPKKLRHGEVKHPLYQKYHDMKSRCYHEGHHSYKDYGGRGIKLADEWLGLYGFINFKNYIEKTIGARPSPQYSLDRIDNDKGYLPGNLRWATRHTQSLNRRMQSNNSSGYVGVTRKSGKWQAGINRSGKFIYLGTYKTAKEAAKHVQAATKAMAG